MLSFFKNKLCLICNNALISQYDTELKCNDCNLEFACHDHVAITVFYKTDNMNRIAEYDHVSNLFKSSLFTIKVASEQELSEKLVQFMKLIIIQ